MGWYAAHAIVAIRQAERQEGPISAYENVILIQATDDNEAMIKARRYAEASVVKDETLTLNGQPAEQSFVGVRKVIAVSNPWPLTQERDRPVDGTELTYSEFELDDQQSLKELADGGVVAIRYLE